MDGMRLGIGSYTYVWAAGVPGYPQPEHPLTACALLEKAVGLGVRVVQIADNLPLDCLSDGDRDALRQRARALGIELEVGMRGIDPDPLLAYVRMAHALEATMLRVVTDGPTQRPSPDDVIRSLRPLVPELERMGVTLAIENHDRMRAATLRNIVDRIDSARVGICLDTANSFGCLEGPDVVLETLGSRTVNVHIKDFCVRRLDHNKGFVIKGRPAGKGQLDIPRLLDHLRATGRDPNVILEQWPAPEPTIEASVEKEDRWAEAGIQYLRKFVSE